MKELQPFTKLLHSNHIFFSLSRWCWCTLTSVIFSRYSYFHSVPLLGLIVPLQYKLLLFPGPLICCALLASSLYCICLCREEAAVAAGPPLLLQTFILLLLFTSRAQFSCSPERNTAVPVWSNINDCLAATLNYWLLAALTEGQTQENDRDLVRLWYVLLLPLASVHSHRTTSSRLC